MEDVEIVKEWDYKGKKCVILLMRWMPSIASILLHDYYNGYVETTLDKSYNDELISEISVHGGLTFGAGELSEFKGKKFFGFDTAHAFDKGIKHRNLDYVIKKTEKLADQLIRIEERYKEWEELIRKQEQEKEQLKKMILEGKIR